MNEFEFTAILVAIALIGLFISISRQEKESGGNASQPHQKEFQDTFGGEYPFDKSDY